MGTAQIHVKMHAKQPDKLLLASQNDKYHIVLRSLLPTSKHETTQEYETHANRSD